MALPNTAAVTLADVKAQLNQTLDVDDALIERKIMAAQAHVESWLGFALADRYPTKDEVAYPATVPPPLVEAVCQLAAWWYAQREAVLVGVSATEIPLGVKDIVDAHRDWSWGEADTDAA